MVSMPKHITIVGFHNSATHITAAQVTFCLLIPTFESLISKTVIVIVLLLL